LHGIGIEMSGADRMRRWRLARLRARRSARRGFGVMLRTMFWRGRPVADVLAAIGADDGADI
jgi:hypothetical protein